MRETQTVPATHRLSNDGATELVARRGRPTGDHEAKRTELLKAAMSVIAQEGFAAASLRKVAERAGCTTGTVTYYFANKEELVIALVESGFDRFDAMLEASRSDTDLRTLFERWLARTKDPGFWPVMFELLAHARHEPALAAVIERRYAHYREVSTAMLGMGQARGTVRDDIPADLLADQLSALGDGWMMMFPIERDRFTPPRVRALLDATIALISPPPANTSRARRSR